MIANIILLFLYPAVVSASPISTPRFSNSSACIAVILTLIFLLSVLAIVKFAYMKYRRRVYVIHSTCPLHCHQRASSSFFDISDEKSAGKSSKSAFFVGLLGSPAWETSVKALYDRPSPYANQIYLQSRSRMDKERCASNNNKISISEFGGLPRPRTSSLSDTLPCTLVTPLGSPSSELPTYPANARLNTPTPNRRHSLPACTPSNDRRRKGHSVIKALNSTKSRRSDISSVPGLRLVPSVNGTGISSSPTTESSFLDFEIFADSFPIFTSTPSKSNHTVRSPAPPLPCPPPVLSLPLSGDPHTPEGRNYISRPYALAPKDKHNLSANVTNIKSPEPYVSTTGPQCLSPLDYLAPPSPFKFNAISVDTSTKAATFPRMKHTGRSPSIRVRKSPPIGPSPLRIMTFPELSRTDISSDAQTLHNQNKDNANNAMESLHRGSSYYAEVGLGYPSSWDAGAKAKFEEIDPTTLANINTSHNSPVKRCQTQPSGHHPISVDPSGKNDDSEKNEADVMLGIIQELVEETSQWDSSLHMDDSFKALIQTHSGRTSSKYSPKKRHARSSSCSTASTASKPIQKKTVIASKSLEVDLGLLELDAVRMESFRLSTIETPVDYQYYHQSSLPANEEEETGMDIGLAW